MKVLSFKTFLLGATLACAANSPLVAKDPMFMGIYAGVVAISVWSAKTYYQKAQECKKLESRDRDLVRQSRYYEQDACLCALGSAVLLTAAVLS